MYIRRIRVKQKKSLEKRVNCPTRHRPMQGAKTSSRGRLLHVGKDEYDKAERCFNAALEALPDPPPIDDLVNALNKLIINFDSGKYNIPRERMAAIQKAAEKIKKLPATSKLEVGGHTDTDGKDAINQPLSENRATAVRDALVKYGVNSAMLTTKGYGASKPKVPNTSEDNKFQNRRIEYTVLTTLRNFQET